MAHVLYSMVKCDKCNRQLTRKRAQEAVYHARGGKVLCEYCVDTVAVKVAEDFKRLVRSR